MIKEKLLIFRKVEKVPAKDSLGKSAKPAASPAAEKAEVRRDSQNQRTHLADTSASELIETTPKLSVEERTRLVFEALVNSYTNDEKIRALFDQTKMNLDVAFDALMKIKPAIVKRLEEGYRFESYSEDGLIWHWSKAGQKIPEINPIFKQEGILKMMDQNARRKLEGLKNAIVMERAKRYIDQHIINYLKKFRPNLGKDSFYDSYLIREEVIPILAAGYEEGARPYEFVATAQGFQLKSDIAVFNTHDFVLSDYDWNLNLRIVRAQQSESVTNLETSTEEWEEWKKSLKESFSDLVTEEDRKQAEEEALIKQAVEDNFAAENAAADNLTNSPGHAHASDPEDLPAIRDAVYEQMDNLSAKNELLAEDAAAVRGYMDYLYQATNGGRNTPSSEEDRTRLIEAWPGYSDLERETQGAFYMAQQRGDYEFIAAVRIQNRLLQHYMVQMGF